MFVDGTTKPPIICKGQIYIPPLFQQIQFLRGNLWESYGNRCLKKV